jgi:RimJ/RimL family protein N-acetyltransferase
MEAELITAYGIPLGLRRVEADDRHRLAVAFAKMTLRARYDRFLGPKPRLTSAELTQLTDLDHRTHEALAAIDQEDGSIVGIARYASEPHAAGTADVAFFVLDAWQGQGIATRLGRELVARADAAGIERLTASTFAGNRAARGVLRRLGFRTTGIGAGVVELERAAATS